MNKVKMLFINFSLLVGLQKLVGREGNNTGKTSILSRSYIWTPDFLEQGNYCSLTKL